MSRITLRNLSAVETLSKSAMAVAVGGKSNQGRLRGPKGRFMLSCFTLPLIGRVCTRVWFPNADTWPQSPNA